MIATGIHNLDALIGLFGRITRAQAQSLRRVLVIDIAAGEGGAHKLF